MGQEEWVQCPKCGRKLAQIVDGVLVIKDGKKAARIYGGVCVALDCDRCNTTFDLPLKIPVGGD